MSFDLGNKNEIATAPLSRGDLLQTEHEKQWPGTTRMSYNHSNSPLVVAQQPASNLLCSQLVLNSTAEVLPNLSLAVNGGTSLLSTHSGLFRGNIALGLGDVAEVSLARTEGVINALGATQPDLTWALKLKILSSGQDEPQVALRIQSSLRWISDQLSSQDIQAYSPTYMDAACGTLTMIFE